MAKTTAGTVRYSRLTFRLLGCSMIGLLAALVALFGVLDPFEAIIHDWFLSGREYGGLVLSPTEGMGVVLLLCLVPASLRVEQPLAMAAWGMGVGFVYCLVAAIILLVYETTVPVLPALAGLSATTGLLGFLAWSDERLRRRRLQATEKARQQFTDMLVHDLRRRMSSILMSLSALEINLPAVNERIRTLMTTMRASSERMLLLTANLLDIRRMQENRLVLRTEPASLTEILRESLNEHRAAADLAGVSFHMAEKPDAGASVDRGILSRVLSNLLWNAIQHAPAGSSIEIECGRASSDRVYFSMANGGEPIPPDRQAGLFTAFASGDMGPANSAVAGTGLGLAFSRLAVEAHGGTITLESPQPGLKNGVRVLVTLPSA